MLHNCLLRKSKVLHNFIKGSGIHETHKGWRGSVGSTSDSWLVNHEFEFHQMLDGCFLEQETLRLLLSTGVFQEWIRTRIHNQT